MPTVWLMLLANVRSSLAVLTCCEASMSGYFHVGLRDTAPGTWQRPPSRASNGTLSRRVLEGKRTCHGDSESDVHDPTR